MIVYRNFDLNLFHGDFEEARGHTLAPPDLAMFSPPYKEKDGYSEEMMERLGKLLADILAKNASVVMNFGQLKEDFDRPHKALQALVRGSKDALKIGQTIIWVKSIVMNDRQVGHYQPINSHHLLNYCWEYLFVLHKGDQKPLNRLSIGVPFADKTNLNRGDRGKNGDVHCAGDVWFIPYTTTGASTKKKHAYEYPEELVTRVIKLFEPKVMFEPFLGSGTTVWAAKTHGVSIIGTDLSLTNVNTACVRYSVAEAQKRIKDLGDIQPLTKESTIAKEWKHL